MRLLAVSYFLGGMNRTKVALALRVGRRSVNNWVTAYLRDGVEGLASKKQTGRPSSLSESQYQQLSDFIQTRSQSEQGGRLTGQDIVNYIEVNFGRCYHLNHIYKILRKLGFSWITSRSRHPKQSTDVQEDFKKIQNQNDL